MEQVVADFVVRQSVFRQNLVHQPWDRFDREVDQAGAIHIQTTLPTFSVPGRNRVFGCSASAVAHDQHVRATAVAAELISPQRGLVGGGDQSRRGGVPKNGPQAAIIFIDVFAVRFRRHQQNFFGNAGSDQSVGHGGAVHKPAAAEIEIDRATLGSQPQPILQQARSRRQRIIRRLGAQQDEINRRPIQIFAFEQLLARLDGQIRRRLVGLGDMPLVNPRFLRDQVEIPRGELFLQRRIVFHMFRKMHRDGTNLGVGHVRLGEEAKEN